MHGKHDSRKEAVSVKQLNEFRDAEKATIYQTVILVRNEKVRSG